MRTIWKFPLDRDGDAMTLRVVAEAPADGGKNGVIAESHNGEINDSHRCPPDC